MRLLLWFHSKDPSHVVKIHLPILFKSNKLKLPNAKLANTMRVIINQTGYLLDKIGGTSTRYETNEFQKVRTNTLLSHRLNRRIS